MPFWVTGLPVTQPMESISPWRKAESAAFSLAGGGDTLAALEKFGVGERISYVSTGGGAFLEYVEGKELPAVAMLESRGA